METSDDTLSPGRLDPRPAVSAWRLVVSGACASFVGIGLSRFAYAPLLPAMIAAHWFTPSEAGYLGAANLAGYFCGALLVRRLPRDAEPGNVVRGMLILTASTFLACAFPLSFLWYFTWRFASGLAGGVLMVLVAPLVLDRFAATRKGYASGIVFAGIGAGILASGTVVPALLGGGPSAAWLGLGVLACIVSLVAWTGWPTARSNATPDAPRVRSLPRGPVPARLLATLCLQYGLNAVGLVAHMIFLVDFVARGLSRGLAAGIYCWLLFGAGALLGPIIVGRVADRIGFPKTMRYSYILQTVMVGLLAVSSAPVALATSSLVVGAFVPAVGPIVLGRLQLLTAESAERRNAAWTWCTLAFAAGQASGAYGLSYILARVPGCYALLFACGAAALGLAFLLDLRLPERWPAAPSTAGLAGGKERQCEF